MKSDDTLIETEKMLLVLAFDLSHFRKFWTILEKRRFLNLLKQAFEYFILLV